MQDNLKGHKGVSLVIFVNTQGKYSGEAASLAGKIDPRAMGARFERQSHKMPGTKKTKASKKQAPSKMNTQKRDILNANIEDGSNYRPKTKQNIQVYSLLLSKIYKLFGDVPEEQLHSIANEILATLMTQGLKQDQKRTEIESLFQGEKLSSEFYADLVNISKNITDYRLKDNEQHDETNALIFQNSQEEQQNSVIEQEENEESQEQQEELKPVQIMEEEKPVEQVKQTTNYNIDTSTIDGNWLLHQLVQYYPNDQPQHKESQILEYMRIKNKNEYSDKLFTLLGMERKQFVKLLIYNKMKIYYCVKLGKLTNDKQKQHLVEQMRKTSEGEEIIQQLLNKKNKNITLPNILKREKAKEEDEHLKHELKNEDVAKIAKKIIDLETIINIEKHHLKSDKLLVPEGSEKISKSGYQQIRIPAPSTNIDEKLVKIDTLPSWIQQCFPGVKKFNPVQSRVLDWAISSPKNMLICAPTSSGKTNIAMMSILQTLKQYLRPDGSFETSKFKIVYIAPMKALVSEITGNLGGRLKSLKVRQLTGDMQLTKQQINETQIIVTTPEKWDIVTRKAGDRLFTELVRLIIIDQIHLLGDSRGPVLEAIIARTIRQVEQTQELVRIVGLSATLPNYKDIAEVLRVEPQGTFYFDGSYRPIPLEQIYIGISQKKGVRKMLMLNEILYEKIMQRSGNNNNSQILVFVHSRRDTIRTAKSIRQTAFMKDQLMKILRPDSDSKKVLTTTAESRVKDQFLIHNEDLRSLLPDGIGIHHAGLSRDDRQLVENLFADKHIQILVSTATLAWGVNLPAHTVIIKGTQVYSPQQGKWIELSQQDIFQMMGRAGRLKYDTSGEGIIITGYNQLRYYLGILNTQFPIESQFVTQLPDQLNAEIVLGNITNLKQAVDWLSYTYLNVRMLKSPAQYGITVEELEQDPHLIKRRVYLIHSAATLLDKSGLIKYDKRANTFSSTALGKIASYYYVKYQSIAIYNENIKPNMNLIDLFKVFAMSVEFKLLPVREQQKGQLARLIETVPIPVKGTIQQTTTKISILLQAYISRIPMEGYALNSDKVYVTQSASRIMRAIYEICLKRNWGQATQVTLNASKMIDRGMWSCMNPLRQFKQVPDIILTKLEKKEQFSWQTFYQMSPQQISELVREQRLGKPLHKLVHQIPRVQIEAYAQPITTSCLRVDVNVKSDFSWDDSVHGREQPFILMIFDCDEEHILYSSNFSLRKDEREQFIQFTVPLFDPPHPIYYIKVFSDRWVTQEHTLPLSFKSLKLPNKFPAPTQLEDTKLTSLSTLPAFNQISKQTKISHLNQIQSQVFESFVYDDSNIFLGSSAGSGKFTLSIFTMYRVLAENKKVIILMPNQQSIKNRYQTLHKIFGKKVTYFINQTNKDIESLINYDIILTSPESWDVVSRRWKIRKGFQSIGLFIVVDIHLIGQSASTMQIIISRMRYISSQFPKPIRIIALGCSIANYRDVAEWIGCSQQNMFNFSSSIRQHPIDIIIQSFDQVIRESRIYSMEKQVYQNIKMYGRSSIIFVNDRRQAKLTALDMVTLINSDSNSKKFMKMSEEDLKVFLKNINDKYLAFSLEHGVGFLYEGMTQNDRDIIEQLFQVEAIGILIVTFKLRWEINLKAFLVAILDCSTFQGRENRWVDYSVPDMLQMMSFAVTSQKDRKRGKQFMASKFYVMTHSSKRQFYKKFLFESYPVESTLNFYLPTHVNAEIVSKTIQSKQDCIDWITWTFMYRRLTQNPNYYNLQEASEIGINDYLSELIENTVEYLESIKCIEVEDEIQLSPTNLGIVCSYYYLSVSTMAKFVEKLTEDEKLKSLVELLSQAAEFDFVSYRTGERQLVAELCVPLQINPINKAQGLLLLHFNRTPLTPDLLEDCRKILPIAVRLLHSLVDVVSSFGYLKSLIAIMQLCQMVVQAVHISDSPLIQVVDKQCAEKLQSAGITSINDFVNMQDDDRNKLMKDYDDKQMENIADLCNRYPVVTLTYQVQQVDEEEIVVNINLERDNELETEPVKCPFYPKVDMVFIQEKQENWWIVIGDKSSNRVLTTKKATFNKEANVTLKFEPTEGVRLYTIYAFCDSYMGCDLTEQLIIK